VSFKEAGATSTGDHDIPFFQFGILVNSSFRFLFWWRKAFPRSPVLYLYLAPLYLYSAPSTMAGSTTEKIQPWKSFPPPEKKAEGGVYEYPELKKGDVMVTSTRSASFFEAHCGPKPTEDLAQSSESRI